MNGVWYAAIGAAFLLGLIAIAVFAPSRRPGSRTSGPRSPRSAHSDEIVERARAQAAELVEEGHAAKARFEADARQRLADAETAAARRVEELAAELAAARHELQAQVQALDAREQTVVSRSRALESETRELDRDVRALQERRADLEAREQQVQRRQAELDELVTARDAALQQVADLTLEQARAEVMRLAEAAARRDTSALMRTIEAQARADATATARRIVADAVQRVASDQTSESVVSVMPLPADDMKGRIIGREGRNIRSFEAITGVNVIIDDTPEAVLLSCFDPVRREVGRLTLERLVLDGRIHPHRIEEAYERSRAEVDALCERAARDALADVGISSIDDRLIPTIGRLKYRTSYGQNVLGHLIESAHIGALMAAEMGIDPQPVKRAAFLHDIGKALTHEVEGSHAVVGAALLRRFGESEDIAYAVEAHHDEVPPQTVLDVLIQAADACSAARPGARREALEAYVSRLGRIEAIAAAKPGVDKVFAMQSGREVRVMVSPSDVDDLAASVIAREIAKEIEDELTYPGQIRVTVVRETRAIEIAH